MKLLILFTSISISLTFPFTGSPAYANSPKLPSDMTNLISEHLNDSDLCHFNSSCKTLNTTNTPQKQARADIRRLRGEVINVEGGEFEMGPLPGENIKIGSEKLHKKVTHPIRLGKYLVTQERYLRVMGTHTGVNPSLFKNPGDCPGLHEFMVMAFNDQKVLIPYCKGHPVENLKKIQMEDFLKELTAQIQPLWKIAYPNDPRKPRYVLPSEEQWEKATQKKNVDTETGTISFEHNVYSGTNDEENLDQFVVSSSTHERTSTAPVGTKDPNSQGFYDLSGNVSEMTSSQWVNDPTTPDSERTSPHFVRRGGSWNISLATWKLRASMREEVTLGKATGAQGFRLGEVFD